MLSLRELEIETSRIRDYGAGYVTEKQLAYLCNAIDMLVRATVGLSWVISDGRARLSQDYDIIDDRESKPEPPR